MEPESFAGNGQLRIRVTSLQQMCSSKFTISALTLRAQHVLFYKKAKLNPSKDNGTTNFII